MSGSLALRQASAIVLSFVGIFTRVIFPDTHRGNYTLMYHAGKLSVTLQGGGE